VSTEIGLLLAFLFLAGNAFFVGAEFGLIASRRSSIELYARSGSKSAKATLKAMEHLSFMLAGAQLGVTLCSLGLGAVGEPIIARLLEHPLGGLVIPNFIVHPLAYGGALAIMVYAHVVFGEMVPKNVALAAPDRTALMLTPLLSTIVRFLRPLVNALNVAANQGLRILGVEPKAEVASTFTSDEVAGFVEEAHREGLLSEDEEQLVSGALQFEEHSVRKVLVPLERVLCIPAASATPAHVERMAVETGFSRFPIKNAAGALAGYLHVKDILAFSAAHRDETIPATELRPLGIVKPNDSLHVALAVMQRSGSHLAQVVNSRGRVLGVVSLEDVLEELVGEIRNEAHASSRA